MDRAEEGNLKQILSWRLGSIQLHSVRSVNSLLIVIGTFARAITVLTSRRAANFSRINPCRMLAGPRQCERPG